MYVVLDRTPGLYYKFYGIYYLRLLYRVCNAASPDILLTVDHGDFDLLSDVTSSPSLLNID